MAERMFQVRVEEQRPGKARTRNGHGKNGKNGTDGALARALPVIEVIEPRRKREETSKITRRRVGRLSGLTRSHKRLILRLFQSPMDQGEAIRQYKLTTLSKWITEINTWARKNFGKDAIIKESLSCRRRPGGFWTMRLDDWLFDVDYSGYDARKHVGIADVLSPEARKVVEKLAKLGSATKEELEAAGISAEDMFYYVTRRNTTTNKQAREKDFPDAILATNTLPRIYRVNPEFAEFCGLEVTRRRELDGLFGGNDLIMLRYLAEHGETPPTMLARRLSIPKQNITRIRHRINGRCKELDLPKAISIKRSTRPNSCGLTRRFSREFPELRRKQSTDLASFFTPQQIELIKFLAQKPFSTSAQVARHLKIKPNAASRQLRLIDKVCKSRNLSPLIRIGGKRTRYALIDKFLNRFNLEQGEVDPIVVLVGEKQRKVYRFFKDHPERTTVDARRRIGMEHERVRKTLEAINALLTQAGFKPIEHTDGRPKTNKAHARRAA